jgi:ArsR family transcriptional regulator
MGEHYRERLSGEALEMLAERFKVFSEPMRLKLVYSLMDGEKSVSELVRETGGMQANVSKHLGMLLDAGVVGRRKQGLHAYYRVTDPGPAGSGPGPLLLLFRSRGRPATGGTRLEFWGAVLAPGYLLSSRRLSHRT